MRLLLLFPFFQLLHGLDVSNLIPKVSADSSPCKNCKTLVTSFEKVINYFVYMIIIYKLILFFFVEYPVNTLYIIAIYF